MTPAEQPAPPPTSARQVLKWLGLLSLLGLVGWRFDWRAVRESSRGFSGPTLAGLWVLFSISAGVRIGKWALQVRQMGLQFEPVAFVRSYLVGLLLGSVTPLRMGEFYRVAVLKSATPDPLLTSLPDGPAPTSPRLLAAAGLVLEKALEVSVLLVFIALGTWQVLHHAGLTLVVTLGLLASLAALLTPLAPPRPLLALMPARVKQGLIQPLLQARDALDFRTRAALLSLTFVAHALNIYAGLTLYRGFGTMDAWDFTFRVPLLTLLNQLPVTVGGIGLRELSAMEVFGAMGYPASSAALAATLLFLGSNVFPAVYLLPLSLLSSEKPV